SRASLSWCWLPECSRAKFWRSPILISTRTTRRSPPKRNRRPPTPWAVCREANDMGISHILPELKMGLASLFAHKLRSLLTMLGMIFGVGAVVAMLSITAGAQKEMESFIDQLGVNNIIVEAREALDRNELQTVRAVSPGLTFRDFRAI